MIKSAVYNVREMIALLKKDNRKIKKIHKEKNLEKNC